MKHWTEDDFLSWRYAGDADTQHLEECAECRARAKEMVETHRRATVIPEVSWEFLAAQRRSIYRRLGAPDHHSTVMRWSVAGASLLSVVVLSLALMRPWTSNHSALYTSADEKLFSDLVLIEQSSEPRAIRPIHKLFEK